MYLPSVYLSLLVCEEVLPTVFRYWKQPKIEKIEAKNALETRLIHSINHIQRDAATPSPVGNNNRQSTKTLYCEALASYEGGS